MQENLFDRSFSNRLIALVAVEQGDAASMESSALEFKLLGASFGKLFPSDELCAFSHALQCLALAQRWVEAVREAHKDAARFRDACRLRATEYHRTALHNNQTFLTEILFDLSKLNKPDNVHDLRRRVLRTALPFGIVGEDMRIHDSDVTESESKSKKRLEIAFVKFEINGRAANHVNTLRTNVAYDIGIDIRVSRWPENADRLVVTPISMEPDDTYDFPTFTIKPPTMSDGEGPFVFKEVGRLRLRVAAAFGARPFEFKYRAVFEPSQSEQPLNVFGHRSLRLESVDHSIGPISGYAEIDRKLLELRNDLRMIPGLPDTDLANALEVCACLGNLAGQALSDGIFAEGTKEDAFQVEVIKGLRRWPNIGEELEKHPHTGGGICDLSFNRIRIELKAVPVGEIEDLKVEKFSDQTAQYVVSSGKGLGILCVLDSRRKIKPPGPPESHMRIVTREVGIVTIPIIHLRIEGGLARPSDLSR